MATKTKKKSSTKKKAVAKKAAATTESSRTRHDREALMPQVVELRDSGLGWEKIASELGIDPGLARLLWMTATVKPKDRIKGDEDEVAAGIVEARDEDKNSWGLIAARARLPESKVRKIYEETTGESHQQGYKVVQERTAAKATAKGEGKKGKASSSNKAKKAAVSKNRKAKTGSSNPS